MMVTINIVSSGEKNVKEAAFEAMGAPGGADVFSGSPAPQAGGLPATAEEAPAPVLLPAALAGEEAGTGMPVPGTDMLPAFAEASAAPEPALQPPGVQETKKAGNKRDGDDR